MGTLALLTGLALGVLTRFWRRQPGVVRPTVAATKQESRIVERIAETTVIGLAGYCAGAYVVDIKALAALVAIGLVLILWRLENETSDLRKQLATMTDQLEAIADDVRNLPL